MFVALEGIDTSGKSTQIRLLHDEFPEAIMTQEPSDSDFGKAVRELALNSDDNATQALLFMSDRAQHAKHTLNAHENALIISDRSLISGIAYAHALDMSLAIAINLAISPRPNLVVILKTNEAILRARLGNKAIDNIEKQGVGYLLGVQERIICATKALGAEYLIIPCDKPQDEICATIAGAIRQMRNAR